MQKSDSQDILAVVVVCDLRCFAATGGSHNSIQAWFEDATKQSLYYINKNEQITKSIIQKGEYHY